MKRSKQRKQKKVIKTKKLLCITYKKDEKRLLRYFRYKKVTDNKTFSKTIEPFQSDKIVSTERITLIDNGEAVLTESHDIEFLRNSEPQPLKLISKHFPPA